MVDVAKVPRTVCSLCPCVWGTKEAGLKGRASNQCARKRDHCAGSRYFPVAERAACALGSAILLPARGSRCACC